jgi:hypothetical protein
MVAALPVDVIALAVESEIAVLKPRNPFAAAHRRSINCAPAGRRVASEDARPAIGVLDLHSLIVVVFDAVEKTVAGRDSPVDVINDGIKTVITDGRISTRIRPWRDPKAENLNARISVGRPRRRADDNAVGGARKIADEIRAVARQHLSTGCKLELGRNEVTPRREKNGAARTRCGYRRLDRGGIVRRAVAGSAVGLDVENLAATVGHPLRVHVVGGRARGELGKSGRRTPTARGHYERQPGKQ